jgi:hypothetical protein
VLVTIKAVLMHCLRRWKRKRVKIGEVDGGDGDEGGGGMHRMKSLCLRGLCICNSRKQKNKAISMLSMYILYVHDNLHLVI